MNKILLVTMYAQLKLFTKKAHFKTSCFHLNWKHLCSVDFFKTNCSFIIMLVTISVAIDRKQKKRMKYYKRYYF